VNSSVSSNLFPSICFSSVIEVFFRCYFKITRRSMLRSQDELNTTLTVCSKDEIRCYCPFPPLAMDLGVCLKRKIQLCSGSIILNFITFSGIAIITSQVNWEGLMPGQFRLKCTRETHKKLSDYHLDLHTPPLFVILSTQKSILSFHSITPPLNQVHWSHRSLYCIKPSVKYHLHCW